MKITFFTTNSSAYPEKKTDLLELPSREEEWKNFLETYPELEISFVLQKPGRFLLDDAKPSFIKTVILSEDADALKVSDAIEKEKPDLAVPVTYWESPFDWLSLKDSLVCAELEKRGITTAGHSEKTAYICFDKDSTKDFLRENSFNCAESVHVHHELYWAERNRREISYNIYKESLLHKIRKLALPLVVKNTTGLSSYGMDVCKTADEAIKILNSKKTNGDRLVEEFLEGPSFGIEIYGSNNKYAMSSPFINSVNQFGLTSPKQNVKLGPVFNNKFRIYDLYRDMERLATLLKLNGICQVDLIFHKENWYIVEINSRISGMTETAAASMNLTLQELIVYSSLLGKQEFEKLEAFKTIQSKMKKLFVMNMKFPLLTKENLQKLKALPYAVNVSQINNLEAKQLREAGYAQIVFGKTATIEELFLQLEDIKKSFPDNMENIFYKNAINLKDTIQDI